MASKLSPSSINELEVQLKEVGMKLLHTPSTSWEILNILVKTNQLLDRVDQLSSDDPMMKALDPVTEALVAKDILGHPDMDVNIAVACCICEILRIMAPNAPYSCRQLEEFFEMVVKTFEKLSLLNFGCYTKMTRFLESFSKVRLSNLMMDLQLENLADRLFKQFLTDADWNTSSVVLMMKDIMIDMMDKSETSELISLAYESAMKECENTSCACWKLGQRVIWNTSGFKFKSYLPDEEMSEDAILATNATSTLRTYATRKRKHSETLEAKDMAKKSPAPQYDIVQGYKVKQSVAAILEAIFKKHGDIASECVFKTDSVKESILEMVCEVVKQIQTNDVTTIVSKMGEIECKVVDAEAANINVSWLRSHLETNLKWDKSQKDSALLMEMKANTSLARLAAEKDLRDRNLELDNAKHLCEEAERRVEVLYAVERKLKNDILESKAEKDLLAKKRTNFVV